MGRVTLVVADDHRIVRGGLRLLLNAEPDFEVVAEADDVESARRAVLAHKPSVLVLDLNMPGKPTLPEIPKLREEFPQTEIVVLTMQDDPAFAREALRAGAAGFLLKDIDPDDLRTAIRTVSAGRSLLAPAVTRRVIEEFARLKAPEVQARRRLDPLTDREREVLALVGRGLSNDEIGGRLLMSPLTAKTHVSRVMAKLGARDRAQLVVTAYETGLVRPGEG